MVAQKKFAEAFEEPVAAAELNTTCLLFAERQPANIGWPTKRAAAYATQNSSATIAEVEVAESGRQKQVCAWEELLTWLTWLIWLTWLTWLTWPAKQPGKHLSSSARPTLTRLASSKFIL